jgi:hypothetical protein
MLKKQDQINVHFPGLLKEGFLNLYLKQKKRKIPQICIIIKTFPVFYERQSYIFLLQFDVFINVSIQIKKNRMPLRSET